MIKLTDTHWITEAHVSEVELQQSGGPDGAWAIDIIMSSGERICVESGVAADGRDSDDVAHEWLIALGWIPNEHGEYEK